MCIQFETHMIGCNSLRKILCYKIVIFQKYYKVRAIVYLHQYFIITYLQLLFFDYYHLIIESLMCGHATQLPLSENCHQLHTYCSQLYNLKQGIVKSITHMGLNDYKNNLSYAIGSNLSSKLVKFNDSKTQLIRCSFYVCDGKSKFDRSCDGVMHQCGCLNKLCSQFKNPMVFIDDLD